MDGSDNEPTEPRPDPSTVAAGRSRVVLASAPVRTADIGGWTDTWFAEYGLVCNIALDHRCTVRVDHVPAAPNSVEITGRGVLDERLALAALEALPLTGAVRIRFGHLDDRALPGAGFGAGAALAVAVVAALGGARAEPRTPAEIAELAHRVDVAANDVDATMPDGAAAPRIPAGVQDHWAAAYGGISLIAVDHPTVTRSDVAVDPAVRSELEARLHTVGFGSPTDATVQHGLVMSALAEDGPWVALDRIRDAAYLAAGALRAGDLDAYGEAMRRNHAALRDLHPALVGPDADVLEQLARRYGARGWKVNGAGGRGGSMALLGPADPEGDAELLRRIRSNASWSVVPTRIATRGVLARSFDPVEPRFDDRRAVLERWPA